LETQIRVGLDIGSTTLKAVVLDSSGSVLYENYERHFSMIAEKAVEISGGSRIVLIARNAPKKP